MHRLLQRQLRRIGLDEGERTPVLEKFIQAVESAYHSFDSDRVLLERGLELSSKELLETSGQLRAILNAFPDMILRLDSSGNILTQKHGSGDRSARAANTYEGKNFVGQNIVEMLSESREADIREAIRLTCETKAIQAFEYYTKESEEQINFYEARFMPFAEGQIIAAIRDITDKKKIESEKAAAEMQLRRATKMQAVGRLAGGVAHDFNNILHSIMGYTELASRKLDKDSSTYKQLQEVLMATNRGKELVEQILIFSRWRERKHLQVSLEDVASEVQSLLKPTLPKNISVNFEKSMSGKDLVSGDPTQIFQVFINLFKNAIQAMQESGGELRVHVEFHSFNEAFPTLGLSLPPGDYYSVVVSDNGPGMSAKVQEKVFEPFFTTKAPGEGTGLGLSLVHGVLQDHSGGITLDSSEGKGSTFRLYFPASVEKAEFELPRDIASQEIVYGSGNILLVDNEVAIASVISEMLIGLGYSVDSFSDATEAGKHLTEETSTSYDLIITALFRNESSSMTNLEQFAGFAPGTPIVLLESGSESLKEELKLPYCHGAISKPISLEELSVVVYKALFEKD